jgi:hypothetical protein
VLVVRIRIQTLNKRTGLRVSKCPMPHSTINALPALSSLCCVQSGCHLTSLPSPAALLRLLPPHQVASRSIHQSKETQSHHAPAHSKQPSPSSSMRSYRPPVFELENQLGQDSIHRSGSFALTVCLECCQVVNNFKDASLRHRSTLRIGSLLPSLQQA